MPKIKPCPFCGSSASTWYIHQKFCPECGRSYSKTENYCNYDGTELKLKGVGGEV